MKIQVLGCVFRAPIVANFHPIPGGVCVCGGGGGGGVVRDMHCITSSVSSLGPNSSSSLIDSSNWLLFSSVVDILHEVYTLCILPMT